MRLVGKVAIVTGAASGIGQATALLFAQEGAKVVVADCDSKKGQSVANSIKRAGAVSLFADVDVSKSEDVQMMVETTIDNYGKIDVLFNNAGIRGPPKPVNEVSLEEWQRVLDVNLKGVYLCSKYAVKNMMENDGGSIINTASIAGLIAAGKAAPYHAAKGGVVALTKNMALSYAQHNIRVNCIAPSVIDTSFFGPSGDRDEAVMERVKNGTLLRRIGRPEDVAYAALYLASDESTYVTGICLPVDGGYLAL